jgi:hypothetical protein
VILKQELLTNLKFKKMTLAVEKAKESRSGRSIYLAAPLFTEEQCERNLAIHNAIMDAGYWCIMPADNGVPKGGADRTWSSKLIYNANIDQLHSADRMVAVVDDKDKKYDLGTMFEMGRFLADFELGHSQMAEVRKAHELFNKDLIIIGDEAEWREILQPIRAINGIIMSEWSNAKFDEAYEEDDDLPLKVLLWHDNPEGISAENIQKLVDEIKSTVPYDIDLSASNIIPINISEPDALWNELGDTPILYHRIINCVCIDDRKPRAMVLLGSLSGMLDISPSNINTMLATVSFNDYDTNIMLKYATHAHYKVGGAEEKEVL